MKTYGSFEVVDSLAEADDRGNQHYLARKANSDQEPDKVIKLIKYLDAEPASLEASEPFQKTRMQSQFISALKSQQIATARGSTRIVPVHEFGSSNEGMWYCTDFYPRGSLRQLIGQTLDADSLKHLAYSIVRGLIEMRKYCKRAHGDLTPEKILLGGQKWDPIVDTPIYLTEPSAHGSSDPRKAELGDLRNLGWIICQLVTKKEFASPLEIPWPIQEVDPWKVFLGNHALFWVELCNRLLDPGLTLEEVSLKRLRRLLRPKFSFKRAAREFHGQLRFRVLWKFAVLAILLGFVSLFISKPAMRREVQSQWTAVSKWVVSAKDRIAQRFAAAEPASDSETGRETSVASQKQDTPAESDPAMEVLHQKLNEQQNEISRLREKELELAQKLETILENQDSVRETARPTERPKPAASNVDVSQSDRPDSGSLRTPVGNRGGTATSGNEEARAQELRGRFVRPLVNRPLATPAFRPSAPLPIQVAFATPRRTQAQSSRLENRVSGTDRRGEVVPPRPLQNTLGMKFEWVPRLPPQSDAGTSTPGGFVGIAEVTQQQFERVVGVNPSEWKGPDRPVHGVSWQQAMDFCRQLTRIERQAGHISEQWEYTLPTRRQWQYFANIPANQAGREWEYLLGLDRIQWEVTSYREDAIFPRAVDAFRKPNAFNLLDVFGNVREWSLDRHQGHPVALGWAYTSTGEPIDRGAATISFPGEQGADIGFRCVVLPLAP